MSAGFGIADITPRGGCELGGFGMRDQPALGVHKALQARVLILESGRVRTLVSACDLLGLSIEESRRIETAMGRAVGVPARNVLLTCTHTHSAPMAPSMPGYDKKYMQLVRRQLIQAARQARDDLLPVESCRFGKRRTFGMGYFRCAADEPGRNKWRGMLAALDIRRKGGTPITLLSIGMHPLVFGPDNRYVHPDYPGTTCDLWEKESGGHALFLTGCAGDVHPAHCWVGNDNTTAVQECAEGIVAQAHLALKNGRNLATVPFQARLIVPTVRYCFQGPIPKPDRPEWKKGIDNWQRGLARGRWPTRSPFPIHLLQIGKLVIVGLPAEILHDTGEDLARALRQLHVLTISQAGGVVGYLPRPFAYRLLTYEAASAHIGYGKAGGMPPGTEERIRSRVESAIRRMI